MRNKIWYWAVRGVPEGTLLPWWGVALRALVFPLDTLYWKMSKSRGYDPRTDTWFIQGVRYSNHGMWMLSRASGECYRVERVGDKVFFRPCKPGS